MRVAIFLIGSLLFRYSTAQEYFDKIILSNPYINCEDVTHNASEIILNYYHSNELDSVYQFLDYWEKKCMIREIEWVRTIVDIQSGRYNSDEITMSQINQLIYYKRDFTYRPYYTFMEPFNLEPELNSEEIYQIDSLIRSIARITSSSNVDEQLILDFYASKSPSFTEIKDAAVSSKLHQLHYRAYRTAYRKPLTHFALSTGYIQNFGNISIFGIRPALGMILGGKSLRHNYDFILEFRMGASRQPYSFTYMDSLITEKTWTGMYVGTEYTFDFYQSKRLDVGVSPGIGYDRITALTTDNEYGEDSKFLNSFNKNAGLVFKYKFLSENFIGVHLRYNWTDYKNPGGTPLDGEYFNLRLTFSMLHNYERTRRLKDLE